MLAKSEHDLEDNILSLQRKRDPKCLRKLNARLISEAIGYYRTSRTMPWAS